MVLTCLNLTVRIASEETSFLLLGVCVAGVIFVRPEFLMSLILVMGWLLIYYWRNRRGIGLASAAKLGLFLGGLIVLFRVFGNPLEGEGKFWPAFGQHFSINYIQWHRAPMVAWFDWREIVRATFGDVTSIWAAAVNNSGAFARHIASNVGTYALATILEPMIAPLASLAPRVHGAVAILQLGILTGSGLVLMRALSRDRRLVVGAFPRRLVVAAVALIASNVAAGLLYYPRWHYLVVQTVLLLAGIAALLSAAVDRAARIPSLREAMGFGLALVLLTPNADWGWLPPGGEGDQWSRDSSLPRWSLERERQYAARRFAWTFPSSAVFWSYWTGGPLVASWQAEAVVPAGILENRAFIAAARSLRIDDPVNLLAFLPPYRAYLGPNYRDVEDQELYSSFLEFLRAKEVNMIFVNDKLMRSRKWSQDREFTQFLKDPATHGFRAIEIPSRDSWLLVRKGLE
jgi:hypothetical protein